MNEADFTHYIQNRLADVEIFSDTQGSHNVEINGALKSASKNQTGKIGYPDHIALVEGFVLVMEDKFDRLKLVLRDGNEISQSVDATKNYAVNGAIFYANKIIDGTQYKKIFAFGNAGDRKHHIIKPIFIDEQKNIIELPEVDTFKNFTAENIESYYRRMVLGEESAEEIELKKILRQAETLHEHLRNYGQLGEDEKPLVVSAILLALAEGKNFNTNQLTGDKINTDGEKIFYHVENHLKRAAVRPEVKKERVLSQFRLIKDRPILNTINPNLDKTPLKFFTEFIAKNIFDAVVNNTAEDYLGRFYGEFISYSGGDGQSLGVVLTPRHIAELFCELVDLKVDDVVFDPCCGTGSFLIAAMSRMLKDADDYQKKFIKQKQIHGIEAREDMFSIATTNMILRGDGQSNLLCGDFFAHDADKLQLNGTTVGFMNPPYSQAKNAATAHLSELRFILHLLESVTRGGRVAVIVPVSAMIGKTRDDKIIKGDILKNHTLEGVISLNKNTFYRIGTVPCIALFTAGEPHPKNKLVKFINFEDDGFEVKKHVGLVETERAKDKKFYLLDCWNGKISDAPSKFMVTTTIDAGDEWLHSFYYYNDELPANSALSNTVADYLTYEFNMIVHERGYLFPRKKKLPPLTEPPPPLDSKRWKSFFITDIADIVSGRDINASEQIPGKIPYISATSINNGVYSFVDNENETLEAGCISVNRTGSVGYAFYHPYAALYSNNVRKLRLHVANDYAALFIASQITFQREKYSYGYILGTERLKRQKIQLPVNDADEPDFDYMENYMRFIEEKLLQGYREFVEIAPPLTTIQPLSEKVWRPFYIGEIFEVIQRGKRLKKDDHTPGDIPYVSSSAQNNGVDAFIGNRENVREFENCATIANSGSVGKSFYHEYKFIASDHVTALSSPRLNKYHYLFLSAQLNKLSEKYSFNREINDVRIRRERLMLPINDAGEPDFDYMEAYMKNIIAEKYRKYLEYID